MGRSGSAGRLAIRWSPSRQARRPRVTPSRACRATKRRSPRRPCITRRGSSASHGRTIGARCMNGAARHHRARLAALPVLAMHHVTLDDDRATRLVQTQPHSRHCRLRAIRGASVGRACWGCRAASPAPRQPLEVSRLAQMFPTVLFIVPYGAGLFREVLMAADACTNIYLDTSSSNNWIRYTPGLTSRRCSSRRLLPAPRACSSGPIRRLPRGWQAASTKRRRRWWRRDQHGRTPADLRRNPIGLPVVVCVQSG